MKISQMTPHETNQLQQSACPSILFVENGDHPLSGIRFETVQQSDYHAVQAASVGEALQKIRADDPVFGVVCNLNTTIDPIAFLEVVRVQEPALPFILVGNNHDDEVASRVFQAGVTEYLVSQEQSDLLFIRLERAVEYYRSRRATMVAEPFRAERLDVLPDAVCVIQAGSVVVGNERFRDLVGVDGRALAAVSPSEIFDPETLSIVRETDTISHYKDRHFKRCNSSTVRVDLTVARIEWGGEASTLVICRNHGEIAPVAEASRQFRHAIEAAGHAVYVTDRDETIQYVNEAFEKITGYTAQEALGKTPRLLKSGQISGEYYEELWNTVLAGETWNEVVTNQRKDESLYHADQSIAPITNNGDTIGFVAVQTDVTTKQDIRGDLRTFKSIVERIDDPIMIQNLDGDYQLVNEAVVDRTGLSKGELIGNDEFAFMDEQTAERIQKMKARTLERGEPVTYQVSPELPTNGDRTFSTVRYPQYDSAGNPTGTLAICRDITDLQKHEQQFRVIERVLRRDILAALKDDASRGSYVTPVDSDGWESMVCGLSATGSATKPLLVPARGIELPGCFTTVGVVGLRFGEANTESTARFPPTPLNTTRWDVKLRRTVKVNKDGRCIPAVNGEVLPPCTAEHNIRNNIQVVKGIAEVIGKSGSETVQSHVGQILKTGDELLETVAKERQITAVLTDETPFNPVDLVGVVTNVAERVQAAQPDAEVTVDVPDRCQVSAISMIDRVIQEIVENAVDHADRPDPSVDVRIGREDEWATLTVRDDGPGIPQMERDVLTGREDIGPLYHGRGLGMLMVNLIVQESNGRLEFADNEPQGSVVNVSLPLTTNE